jgi:molybdopterin-guanine dinucleotide biosynthesis protein A
MRLACILAGGLSSRMGRDKAALRLGGKTLLAHIRSVAREAGFRVRVIRRDLVSSCGPLGGVYTALRTSRSGSILFLSCDMPFVNPALLERLYRRLSPNRQAVFLKHRYPGFPFILRQSALKEVEGLLGQRQFALHTLAKRLKAGFLHLSPTESLAAFNVNTPEDFARARELWDMRPIGSHRCKPRSDRD